MANLNLWARFNQYYLNCESVQIGVDISRMKFNDSFFDEMEILIRAAFKQMDALEDDAIADPEGMDATLAAIGAGLNETLAVVISKSGGTPETRNGMLEAEAAYSKLGLKFGAHAVAVTQLGSKLDQFAVSHGFLARFPMW